MSRSTSHGPATVVSVDLDDVGCYHAIHGLARPRAEVQGLALTRWLPRFIELFDRLDVRATFFVVGRDVARDLEGAGVGARWLQEAVAEGHELGNHSFGHAYDLVTWPATQQFRDLKACDTLLSELGARGQGFRAPGYTHDTQLLQQVAALGYRYDSSCLPSLPYYCAKLLMKGWMRTRRRYSASLSSGVTSFVGPRVPHRRSDVELWEIPMSVTSVARLPLIGTSLLCAPVGTDRLFRRAARRLPYFHLELHAIDLADEVTDGLALELCRRQPELRVPRLTRGRRLQELLGERGGARPLHELVG